MAPFGRHGLGFMRECPDESGHGRPEARSTVWGEAAVVCLRCFWTAMRRLPIGGRLPTCPTAGETGLFMSFQFRHSICNEAFEGWPFADAAKTIRKAGY